MEPMCNFFNKSFLFSLLLLLPFSVMAAPPLAVYGALPSIDSPALSPSGKRVAMVATLKDQRSLLVMEPGGKLLTRAEVGDMKIIDLVWAGEDYLLVLFRTTQNLGPLYGFKYELGNILVLDIKKSTHSLPLENSKVANATFGFYGAHQLNGRWYADIGTLPMQRVSSGLSYLGDTHPKLTRVDLETGKLERVAEPNRNGDGWLLDRAGAIIANERYDDSAKMWTLYSGAHEERLLLNAKDPLHRNHIIGQGRTSGTVLYSIYGDDNNSHRFELKLDGSSEPVEILQGINVSDFRFDAVSGLFDSYVKSGDAREIVSFNPDKRERIRVAREAFPNHNVRFYSASDDFNRLIVETDGSDDPGTWWLVDIPTLDAAPIGYNYPAIADADVNPWRVVHYKAADGLALEGILTVPSAAKTGKLPLVVMPHGGPEARDYPMFDWWAQAFASRGYAVWQPNFRGSAGYGAELRNAGFGEFGRKMQSDISDGVAALAREGVVDSTRACIVGASYGGYAALAGVTVQQGLYRCAVSVAGLADIELWLRRVPEKHKMGDQRYWLNYMGTQNPSDKALDAISPVLLAHKADAPVLLIHGKDDTVVLIEQSQAMESALKAAGKPVELITLQGEDHWLSLGSTRTAMLEAAVAFVQRHNPANSVAP
ncbi:MAG: prolyl oligopeptidase family protein [Verrucomicrobiaceae bacterium]|nr:prolyl oligopeptidase family protein [Verrucomicrobiaceae bacterium]